MPNPESDLDEAIAWCELRRETLYRHLLGCEDEHHRVPRDRVSRKQRKLELAMAHNPLAIAIVERRPLRSEHPLLKQQPFNNRPVTCFGVHEILRHTRFDRDFADGSSPGVLMLGSERVTHDQLLGWYRELIPNVNLGRVYDRAWLFEQPAVAPVLAGVLTGALVGIDAEPGQARLVVAAGVLGAAICAGVLYWMNRTKYGRQLKHTAPWNSSLYVDVNLALLRDHPADLHLGCRAYLPRPVVAGWKLKSRYYPLAEQVIDGRYWTILQQRKEADAALTSASG